MGPRRRSEPKTPLSTTPGLILVEPERFLERGEDFVPVGRVVPAIHPPEIAQRLLDPGDEEERRVLARADRLAVGDHEHRNTGFVCANR